MSRGYFQRLMGRAVGEPARRVTPAAPAVQLGSDAADPFEAVAPMPEAAPRATPPAPIVGERHVVTETVRELAPVIAAPVIVPAAVPAPRISPPDVTEASSVSPIVAVAASPTVATPSSPAVTHELPPLRPPAERETVVERWLAPAPSPLVPREPPSPLLAPATAPAAKPAPVTPPTSAAPLPITPHVPPPAPPPPIDRRPSLAIGRLVVEVMPAAPAPAAPVTTIVHTAAPAAPRPLPNVLDRGFGLGQS
jgi:hypothetical protein